MVARATGHPAGLLGPAGTSLGLGQTGRAGGFTKALVTAQAYGLFHSVPHEEGVESRFDCRLEGDDALHCPETDLWAEPATEAEEVVLGATFIILKGGVEPRASRRAHVSDVTDAVEEESADGVGRVIGEAVDVVVGYTLDHAGTEGLGVEENLGAGISMHGGLTALGLEDRQLSVEELATDGVGVAISERMFAGWDSVGRVRPFGHCRIGSEGGIEDL